MSVNKKQSEDFAGREFIITREFDAPRSLVFAAWTDPKHLEHWWGPEGFTNPVCEWDARPGGKIHDVMRAPHGVDYPMTGEFLEITPPSRVVFSCGPVDEQGVQLFEFLHDATFTEKGEKTLLTLRSRVTRTLPGAERYIGGFEAGMTQSLERLAVRLIPTGREILGARIEPCLENETSDREILITRTFDAPRRLVWEAMTDAKQVVHWWGPNGFTTTVEEMDLRPGGNWKLTMVGPDGTKYPNHHVFKEVQAPERIVYQLGGRQENGPCVSALSTWTFEELGENQTKLTIRMVFDTPEARDNVVKHFNAIEGGKQTLGRLREYLTNRS